MIIHQSTELDWIVFQMSSTMNPEGAIRALKKLIQNLESGVPHTFLNEFVSSMMEFKSLS
jgi:hypothetical protein